MMPVNKQAVAAAFGRAAQSYSQHDELQRQSAEGLLAALGENDRTLDDLLRRADDALYEAKRAGRAQVVLAAR